MRIREAVIVEAVRTPIGKRNGSLSSVHPVDLSALVLNELIRRTGVDPSLIDDVMWGCVTQLGDQSSNVARFATLAAGWPESVPAVTVNRACGSGQQAIESAAHAVMSGAYDIAVAGGVEMMSRIPLGAARASGFPYGQTVLDRYDVDKLDQGIGAELISQKWNLSRQMLDEFASRSHELAAKAIDGGAFDSQLVTVDIGEAQLAVDEGLRRGTSPETLAKLKPSFRDDGVIHAGNASQISDGASAVMITTPEKAAELGLVPIVRLLAGSVVGADPVMMLTAPIPATQKVLARAGLGINDIGAIEINEAFAPVPLAWQIELGADLERINPLGGAIAVGHPLGASGAILTTRLVHHMRDRGLKYGLQTICEGGGTANATIYELVE
ncbi:MULTISPECIES: thiolase family protein [Rhodococcus]|uniref:Acetyl-CoA acyltransferase n=2 Tax=Nocardiaceae TaxID=85025 RepID=A0A652YHA6_NOCGL|nr:MULTISPECIES: thiolase family protein [Rhodococcus]MCE4265769.1 thiolase family protein [Rhodococcus globerulus]MDV6270533.1 thiolase family protein [Rhodococcus globerulus]MDV8071051.1 thiolase family protein [Rhodococcus sp. IEGM 1366]PVX63403.1 acetyl-CoA acyltransferase [Rhodococcus globerulus]QXW05222.1 thiolase family protein [Rhodococcus globerulus]